MTDFTPIRDLSQFEHCPIDGEPLDKEKVPEGRGERIEVTCPEHGLLTFPHTGMDWPRGGRKPDEDRQRWADGTKVGAGRD